MPSLLPPAPNMAYYSTRSQVPSTADYYGSMTTTAPMATTMAPMAYEPYAVAPLTMQPPLVSHHPHHSHHSSTSSASYQHHLTPDPQTRIPPSALPAQHRASSGAWNPNDDQTLLGARASGQNWAQIQQMYFPLKTPNACRKRHERLMERKGADDWDNRKLEIMAKEYMSLRKEIWAPLAQRTGEKWNVVEQKCMSNGLKNLQSHARSAARRERIEQGLPPTDPYHDDSGISGLEGLTPVDELGPDDSDPWGGSPDRRSTSHGASSTSSSSSSSSTASYSNPPSTYGLHPSSSYGQPHHNHHHSYSSSVSSSTAGGYGSQHAHQHHSQSPSPYMEAVQRMPSVDMGIDAIINRPGASGGPVQ